jgi:hypothetical protein
MFPALRTLPAMNNHVNHLAPDKPRNSVPPQGVASDSIRPEIATILERIVARDWPIMVYHRLIREFGEAFCIEATILPLSGL